MTIIYILVPLAILLAGAAVAAFLWSIRDGQLDDLESQKYRMLYDDTPADGPADKRRRD